MSLGSIMSGFVSRLVRGATAHNTLNTVTVEVFFQRSPGLPSGDTRGILDLDYQVSSGGAIIQSGRTGADGKIDVRVRGGESMLQLLFNGAVVAEYRVTLRGDALEPATQLIGQQRRLRLLGHQLGTGGTDQIGVDGTMGQRTDRAILEFQSDESLDSDGVAGTNTQNRLTQRAGA